MQVTPITFASCNHQYLQLRRGFPEWEPHFIQALQQCVGSLNPNRSARVPRRGRSSIGIKQGGSNEEREFLEDR